MFSSAKALTCLFLLATGSQAIGATGTRIERRQGPGPGPGQGPVDPNRDVPADARNLPADCRNILFTAGVTAAFKASKANTDEYFVALKFSSSAKDITDILALPAYRGVKPIQVYTKEYDRGFTAKLNYQQVCSLDKDARVGDIIVCEGNACAAEKESKPVTPPPSKNSGIKGAPDISGLSEQCARVVWYTVLEYSPETIDPGKYEAITKIWVTQQESDRFFAKQAGTIRNRSSEADGRYSGKWSFQQLCDIEMSPLISLVETKELPGSSPGPKGPGPKGKGPKF